MVKGVRGEIEVVVEAMGCRL